jgi:hypothetical protein
MPLVYILLKPPRTLIMTLSNLTTLSLLSISVLSISLVSSFSHAQDNPHTVGLMGGVASGEYKNSKNDGDGFAQSYFFYNYQAFENYSIELGYNGAVELDGWECDDHNSGKTTCTTNDKPMFDALADEFRVDGFVVAIKTQAAISKRNSLYAKLGGQYYDYELMKKGKFIEGDDGIGAFVEAGWQYVWDNGIGINAALRYQDMGDLTLKSQNIGISYAF